MFRTYTAAALIFAIACLGACSGNIKTKNGASFESGAEEQIRVHIRDAQLIDQQYELKVDLPKSYQLDSQQRYPVVYVLDGQWNFDLASSVYGSIAYDGQAPEAILVSVTWYQPGAELQALRERDFLPAEPGKTGGAAKFLSVLEMELIPFIESTYRTSGQRVLVGHSLSGAFVAFALLEKPSVFAGYVSVAAPFSVIRKWLSANLNDVGAKGALLGKRLYIGKGALDPAKPGDDWLEKKLSSEAPQGLDFKSEIIDSVGHSGVNAPAMTFGLLHVFRRPRVNLDENFLSRYEGYYSSSEGPPDLQVTAANGHLILNQDGKTAEAFPASSTEFYLDGVNMNLSFTEMTGGVYSVQVKAYGGKFLFERSKQANNQLNDDAASGAR